jgi:hypothetical protein
MEIGKKVWVFADGDLPPQGSEEPFGHEALMVVNVSGSEAQIALTVYFEDQEPAEGIVLTVPAKRVRCFRLDAPVGGASFKIPFGQYALLLKSNVEVVANFGRLDRRKNMAYYPVQGFSV